MDERARVGRSIVVVGSGAAATAAAITIGRAAPGRVRVVTGATGASTLTSGAIDLLPWTELDALGADAAAATLARLDPETLRGLSALDLHDFAFAPAASASSNTSSPAGPAMVATLAGIVRPAAGRDRALLDLTRVPAGNVLVPRCDRAGWDANALARAWTEASYARDRGLVFVAVDVQITRFGDERTIRDADIARRHDEPSRIAWLADRLREFLARGTYTAVALPPWLGVERARASDLSTATGVVCGEAVAGLGGPAGLRFEAARDRALARVGAETVDGWATRVAFKGTGEGWDVTLEDGRVLEASAVVLATGGLVGGGIGYEPSGALLASAQPPHSRMTFRARVDGPFTVGAHRRPLDLPGSLFGAAPESLAWPFTDDPLLERAGVLTLDDARVLGAPAGIFACGDVVADRARTWLDAFAGGVEAGTSALAAAALV